MPKFFNADISKWDVSSVTNMAAMLHHADDFNADISKWDVSAVTDMRRMFFMLMLLTRTFASGKCRLSPT